MHTSDPAVPEAEPELHRFTVEEYMRLGESFPRSELLDGLIYDKQRADQPEPRLHRFTVDEYMRLGGGFPPSELLDGLIYDVPPVNEPHAYAVEVLLKAIVLGLADKPYRVRPGHPLAVQGWHGPWGPHPNVAVVYDERYRKMPTAENSLAFLEVSDSTYAWDRKHKIPIYAASGVPTWQVNLNARQVEYYDHPRISRDRSCSSRAIPSRCSASASPSPTSCCQSKRVPARKSRSSGSFSKNVSTS